MKKIFTMAAIALFMMTSCSDDDSNSTNNDNPSATVLLKKVIQETDEDGTITSTFTYDGNKLIKLTSDDGSYQNYTYTGDLVTNIKYYEGSELTQEDQFTYTNGKLSTFVMLSYDVEWGDKNVYTYNTDGTVTVKQFIGDLASQTQAQGTYTLTYNGENIVKFSSASQTYEYTFDTKNYPMKNIASATSLNLAYNEGGTNNALTYKLLYGTEVSESSTYVYTYNDAGYPLTSKETITYSGGSSVENMQYFYE